MNSKQAAQLKTISHQALRLALHLLWLCPMSGFSEDTNRIPLFKETAGPPPGFEAETLNARQISLIDIYFQNTYLTTTQATFTQYKITFAHPEQILSLIAGLKESGFLSQILQQELATHPELVCEGEKIPYCEPLKPDAIGVIFNINQYRADLFIDPQYLTSQSLRKKTELLPSSAGFSALSQENFFISGSNASRAYSLSNTTVMGQHQSVLTLRSYLQQVRISQTQANNQLELQQLTWGYLQREQFLQLGMLSTVGGSDYLTSQSLLGVSITNQSLASAIGSSTANEYAATSVPVYLTLPSTVRVRRGTELIYMTQLPAGKHLLDTRSFPSGTYDITLEIIDSRGYQSDQKLFFVKADQLPAQGSAQYYFAAGLSQKASQSADQPFFIHPEYTHVPISVANLLYSLGYNYGVNTQIIVTPKEYYLSHDLLYYGNQYQFAPSLLISNKALGYGAKTHFLVRGVSADLALMRMVHRSGINPNADYSSQQALTSSDLQMIGGLNYNWNQLEISLSGRLFRNDTDASLNSSYNLRLAREVYRSATDLLSLSLNAMTAEADRSISLNLNWNMNTPHYYGVTSGGYSYTNKAARQLGQDDFLLDTEWSRRMNFMNGGNALVSGRYHYGNSIHYYGGKTEYRSSKLRGIANMQRNHFMGGLGSTSYSGELNTHLALADGQWSLGYDPVWQSGVLVTVSSNEETPVDIFVEGSLVAHMKAGSPEIIYLAPFKTYNISMMPEGGILYQFNHKPQVVTLYQGNFVHLHWDLKHKMLLFTQILDEAGLPVANALLDDREEFEATDEQGYLQADIFEDTHSLRFKRLKQEACRVSLPEKLEPQVNGFIQIEFLTCHPEASQ